MTDGHDRRWWRRGRTWAVPAVVVAAYPASLGPIEYCLYRGWIGQNAFDAVNAPRAAYGLYVEWWQKRGYLDAGPAAPPVAPRNTWRGPERLVSPEDETDPASDFSDPPGDGFHAP